MHPMKLSKSMYTFSGHLFWWALARSFEMGWMLLLQVALEGLVVLVALKILCQAWRASCRASAVGEEWTCQHCWVVVQAMHRACLIL